MAALKFIDVSKTYGATEVLRNINLEVETGEFLVFVGPSGCGKSTLLRIIAGLERITSGTLEIDGVPMNEVPPAQRGIAMVFQSYALYPHMTVRDNMAFALQIAKKPKAEIDTAVHKVARILELEPYLERLPKALSGGQRQRVAIGRAILRDPKVFCFDEPLSNLDAALRVATRIEIAQLKEQLPQSTMIYVTHDQMEAMTLASRIVVINEGKIEQVGAPLELYGRPANEFVARFIGSPQMNLLPGEVVTTGARTVVMLETGGTVRSNVPTGDADQGRQVHVGLRPEDLSTTSDENSLYAGHVHITEALGEVTLLHFKPRAGLAPVIAKLPGIHTSLRDRNVRLTADPSKVHLFDSAGNSLLQRGDSPSR